MRNTTRDQLKVYGFESKADLNARSRELRQSAFEMLERASHVAELLEDERFKGHAQRYYAEWKIGLQENGNSGSFVSASIDKQTKAVSATVNKDLLQDVTNFELLEPLVGSVMRSVDESYRKVHGLGFVEKLLINSEQRTQKPVDDERETTDEVDRQKQSDEVDPNS